MEGALIENVCNLFSAPECPPERPMPKMRVADAIRVLLLHKAEVKEIGKRPGAYRQPRSLDEVPDSILRKLEAMARAGAVSAAERARDEAAWARRRPG